MAYTETKLSTIKFMNFVSDFANANKEMSVRCTTESSMSFDNTITNRHGEVIIQNGQCKVILNDTVFMMSNFNTLVGFLKIAITDFFSIDELKERFKRWNKIEEKNTISVFFFF